MSFLDLYQGDQEQAAKIQPNEGMRLPSGFDENLHAAWSDGLLFNQSIARSNARSAVVSDYIDEIRQKTGNDITRDFNNEGGATIDYETANARVAKMKESYPDLDIQPLTDEEIDKRAIAKAQAAHRTYEGLQAGERTTGGAVGGFLGSAGAAAADPINIVALGIAPESGGASILSAALRWGALAGLSQAGIEFASDDFKEQVQPGYTESGEPIKNIGGAFLGGALLGGSFKALGNAWTRVKTGQWPTSVRDAGNVIESEANVANTNPFPGVEGEVAHREALVKTIDDVLAGRPVDISAQITPELAAHFDAYHGSPHDFDRFDLSWVGEGEGAQAYGHGLYFAESKGVAKFYSDKLAVEGPGEVDPRSGFVRPSRISNLYQVRITADKEHMLDFDKPLTEQSERVRSVLSKFNIPDEINGKPLSGDDAYRRVGVAVGPKEMNDTIGREAAASKALSEAGIPGIKYLDATSRRAGDGTRNFVVFDDKHVQITHKNGKPVNAETRQSVVDQAMGLPPKQPELPLDAATTEPVAPKREPGPLPQLQTAEEMNKTLTAPDHQDAIRADIDRERAMGDVQVPGIDENGNHSMISVDKAMDEVDAYKQAAEQIQACANPAQEAAE